MSKTWYKVEWAACWCFWNWRNYESSTLLYRTWKDNKTSFHNFITYNNRITGAQSALPSFIISKHCDPHRKELCKILNCFPFYLLPPLPSHSFLDLYYPFQSFGGWVDGRTGGRMDGQTELTFLRCLVFTEEKKGTHTESYSFIILDNPEIYKTPLRCFIMRTSGDKLQGGVHTLFKYFKKILT